MSLESRSERVRAPATDEGSEAPKERVNVSISSEDEYWYIDDDRKIRVLDDEGENEFRRQQREPNSPPAPGYPEFGRMASRAEMPVAPGEIAPPELPPQGGDEESVDLLDHQPPFDPNRVPPEPGAAAPGNPEPAALSEAEQRRLLRAQIKREKILKWHYSSRGINEDWDLMDDRRKERRHMDHDVEEAGRKFRADLLKSLDPRFFQVTEITNPDGTTGHEYTYVGLRYRFTQQEYEWAMGDRSGPPPGSVENAATAAGGSGSDNVSPDQVLGGTPRPESAGSREDVILWNVRTEAFKDITPKTVEQLLKNKESQLFFGQLLDSFAPGDSEKMSLGAKLLSGTRLSAEEKRIVNFATYEYERRMRMVDFIGSKISTADIELIARRDVDFESQMRFRGPERTLEIFKRQAMHSAMREGLVPNQLYKLYNAYQNLDSGRDSRKFQEWNRDLRALCARAGVDIESFDTKFRTGSQEERAATRSEIQKDIKSRMGPFMRAVDWTLGVSSWQTNEMMRDASRLRRLLSNTDTAPGKVNAALADITGIVKCTLVEDPDIDLMIQKEAVSGITLQTIAENGPHTYAEAQPQAERKEKQIEEEFKRHVQDFRTGDGRDWAHSTETERSESLAGLRTRRDEMMGHINRKYGRGFFASAIRALLQFVFGQNERKFIHQPVLSR